jgi:hypothetical protein
MKMRGLFTDSAGEQHNGDVTQDGRRRTPEGETDEPVFGLTDIRKILNIVDIFRLDEVVRDVAP